MKCRACKNEVHESAEVINGWVRCNVCGNHQPFKVGPLPVGETDEGSEIDLAAMAMAELREIAEQRGLNHTGLKKAELLEALSAE